MVWNGGQTCSQLVSADPSTCDQDSVRRSCCGSCRAAATPSSGGVTSPHTTSAPPSGGGRDQCKDRDDVKINGQTCAKARNAVKPGKSAKLVNS